MTGLYAFVAGPLAWAAFLIFFGGLGYRLLSMLRQVRQSEPFIFSYMSLRYSLRSILHWLIPFFAMGWRRNPILTGVTFIFHISLIAAPVFIVSHVVLWDEAWNLSWWTLPDTVVDVMTIVVVAACLFFALRRVLRPEVRFVSDASDYLLLALTAAPFVTGFLAYHQWPAGPWMTIAHMVSGELLLALIPFTRLRHMLSGWLTRAYIGSEFGAVRHARDW
jgi:nitrate reductase gamma subunit